MVKLDVVRACNVELVKSHSLVAVFVGGSTGIGEYSLRALAATVAKNEGKGLRLYLVGRNESSSVKIISDCQEVCPTGDFRFVKAHDLALMKNVDRVCAEILKAEEEEAKNGQGGSARVDFLVMTQGILHFDARKETEEGLDTFMSLLYYSRMRFITQLLPLLLASPVPAHVVSVFGPSRNDRIFLDDLSLRNPKNYGFMNSGSHVAYFKTFFFEKLADKHPGKLSLIHYFPRLVVTPAFRSETYPTWFRWTWSVLAPFSRFFSVPRNECGERVLFLATPRYPARSSGEIPKSEGNVEIAVSSDGVVGGGAYRVTWNGEVIPLGENYKKLKLREQGLSEKSWDHTMKAFEEIEAGKVFTG